MFCISYLIIAVLYVGIFNVFVIFKLFFYSKRNDICIAIGGSLSRGELEGWDLINRLSRHTFAPVPSQNWISNVICRGFVYVQRVDVRDDGSFC